MVPVLLFGLVGIAGLAVVFRMFGDEKDFAGDDPEDDGGGAEPDGGGGDPETGRQSKDSETTENDRG